MVKKVVKTMPVSVFKANCPKLLDEIERDGIEIIVTKRGVPLAKLRPTAERVKELRAEGRR